MSCCSTVKKCSSSQELEKLKMHFDSVEVEDLDRYRLLTLKDRSNKSSIDWTVWLQVKVSYGYTLGYTSKSDDEQLSNTCKEILKWIDVLKNFEKDKKVKQLSLFGDDEEDDELKELPPSPDSDGNWTKYFRDCERVRKNNLLKQYSFFELCELDGSYIYKDIDFRPLLPKSNDELIEIAKETIMHHYSDKSKPFEGRFEVYKHNEWDDKYSSLFNEESMTDFELLERTRFKLSLYFVPYTEEGYVFVDDSFTGRYHSKSYSYRFAFRRGELEYWSMSFDNDKSILPYYTLNDKGFIKWLREFFDIAECEYISDNEVIKENLKCYFNALFSRHKDIDVIQLVNKHDNWKSFRSEINKITTADDKNSGGSGFSHDGLNGGYQTFNKGEVKIIQNARQRISIGRSIDGLEKYSYNSNNDSVYVFKAIGDEILKEAFERFKTTKVVQSSIFDFLVA